MKSIVLLLGLAGLALGQSQVNFYDGSSRLQYVCESNSQFTPRPATWSVTGTTFTSVVVSSNVATLTFASAHYLWEGAQITIAGSTSGTVDGTFVIASVPTGTTVTVALTAANGTYNNAGIVVSSKAYVLSDAAWSITKVSYDSNGNMKSVVTYPGGGAHSLACSDRGKY